MTERANHERIFEFFVSVWIAEGATSDLLVYLFGCYVFYWGGGKGDSLMGEKFCGKNLLFIHVSDDWLSIIFLLTYLCTWLSWISEVPLSIRRLKQFGVPLEMFLYFCLCSV